MLVEDEIEKIWGKGWRHKPELATKLRCIDCNREFYSAFRYTEDCPANGEAQNHRVSKEEPRGISGIPKTPQKIGEKLL